MSIRSGWDRAAVRPSSPSVGYRAAASSIDSAMPSSRSQMERMWSCKGGSSGQPSAVARSLNSATASDSPSSDSDNGGTRYTRSNGTISRARLVASTVTRGQAASSCSRNSATPSRTCSQLSRTSRACRSASAAATDSVMPRPGCSPRPSAPATASATIAGSVTGTRSANHTPSGNAPVASAATASGAASAHAAGAAVTCRCSLSISLSSARSLVRPTNEVSGAGRTGGGCAAPAVRRLAAARPASARRSGTSSFRSSAETWLSAVRTEMNSRAAISALLRWSPTSSSTSASRGEISTVTATVPFCRTPAASRSVPAVRSRFRSRYGCGRGGPGTRL